MKSSYDMMYTIAKLKKAHLNNEVTFIIPDAHKIIFFSKDGSQSGVLVDSHGSHKMFASDGHAQYKIDQIKGESL